MVPIAIVPYGFRPKRDLADQSLDALDWPLGRPDHLNGTTVADLGEDCHLIFYPSSKLWLHKQSRIKAAKSLMIVEPKAIHRRHMFLARLFYQRFSFVLTCNPALLSSIPNSLFLAFGTSWVPEWRDLALSKTKNLSLIASKKNRPDRP